MAGEALLQPHSAVDAVTSAWLQGPARDRVTDMTSSHPTPPSRPPGPGGGKLAHEEAADHGGGESEASYCLSPSWKTVLHQRQVQAEAKEAVEP